MLQLLLDLLGEEGERRKRVKTGNHGNHGNLSNRKKPSLCYRMCEPQTRRTKRVASGSVWRVASPASTHHDLNKLSYLREILMNELVELSESRRLVELVVVFLFEQERR